MDHLLAWQNVVFYIPLVVGLLLVLGSAFGSHEQDSSAGPDAEHDLGHDHAHDGSAASGALGWLGVGRVPLTVVLMMVSFLFGGSGIIFNTILSSFGLPAWIYGPISITLALTAALLLTGVGARLLVRYLPTTESYQVARRDFAGCTGTLLLPASPVEGYAQVKDHEGNVHNIKCRTVQGALPKGGEIMVVHYDEETATYVVDKNPVANKSS